MSTIVDVRRLKVKRGGGKKSIFCSLLCCDGPAEPVVRQLLEYPEVTAIGHI